MLNVFLLKKTNKTTNNKTIIFSLDGLSSIQNSFFPLKPINRNHFFTLKQAQASHDSHRFSCRASLLFRSSLVFSNQSSDTFSFSGVSHDSILAAKRAMTWKYDQNNVAWTTVTKLSGTTEAKWIVTLLLLLFLQACMDNVPDKLTLEDGATWAILFNFLIWL